MFSNYISFCRDLLFEEKQGDHGKDGSGGASEKRDLTFKNLKVSPGLGAAFEQRW